MSFVESLVGIGVAKITSAAVHLLLKGTIVLFAGHICVIRRHFYGISIYKNGLRKNPSPFIIPLESPVFIGVSGGEGYKFTLHYPSLPFNTLQLFAIFRFRLTDATTA